MDGCPFVRVEDGIGLDPHKVFLCSGGKRIQVLMKGLEKTSSEYKQFKELLYLAVINDFIFKGRDTSNLNSKAAGAPIVECVTEGSITGTQHVGGPEVDSDNAVQVIICPIYAYLNNSASE